MKCGPCEEKYTDQAHFWICMLGEMTGVELAGPAAQVAYKNPKNKRHWAKVAKRMLPKVGKKIGAKFILIVGWVLTGVDLIKGTVKCLGEAKRCRPKRMIAPDLIGYA
jgi:hypothetical protein